MDGVGGKVRSGIERHRPAMPMFHRRERIIVVVEDDRCISRLIAEICDFLDVTIQHVASEADVAPVLAECRPMAVLARVDADGQDGCHVMKTVAEHDRNLPILLLTDGDPALAGAADAVQEIWGLSCVVKRPALPGLGELVEFLCLAGRMGRCLGLMPV
jgi:CheY-like chemotaxis protein